MNLIKKILGIKPILESHEFIDKFMNDVSNRNVQMEIYYSERIILQVQSLKHVGFWFECDDLKKEKYKNGFIIFFFLKNKGLEKNIFYNNFKKAKENLDMLTIDNLKQNIKYFLYFFESDVGSQEVDAYIKKVIKNVYKLPEKEPKILFNLRYFR